MKRLTLLRHAKSDWDDPVVFEGSDPRTPLQLYGGDLDGVAAELETLSVASNGVSETRPEDDPDADYVVWQGETGAHDARVHFLHGALHLFDSGAELKKYTWVRTNVPLVDQARAAIAVDAYPLFVAEGTSAKKKAKIRHNAYLYQGFKQFTANVKQGQHCMFIFGHSLAANDDHILVRIGRGRFKKLYVGIFGDPLTDDNQRIMARAQELAAMRPANWQLGVEFYDAASASVWGA